MKTRDVPIPVPCRADWTAMSPADRSRFCGLCDKHVHDLSSMTRDEATALLASPATEGLCVRYLADDAGRIAFAPTAAPRLVPPSRLARLKTAIAAAATLAIPMSLTACMGAYMPQQKVPAAPSAEPLPPATAPTPPQPAVKSVAR